MDQSAPAQNAASSAKVPRDVYGQLGQFRRALREFLAFSEAGAREHGLTSQQHQALLAIRGHDGPEPMTVSELAEALLIKTHSAVGLVARLVERDIVARSISSADRRRVELTLRPKGQAVLEKITRANLQQLEAVSDILGELLQTAQQLRRDTGAQPPG